jgi:peptidoglycan-N-acetylglucosamine deacetylase
MAEHHLPQWSAAPVPGRRTSFIVFVGMLVVGAIVAGAIPSTSAATSRASARPAHPRRPAPTHHVQTHPTPSAASPPTDGSTTPAGSPVSSPAGGPAGGHAATAPAGSLTADPMNTTLTHLVSLGQPIYCGGSSMPLVALTFDDGPGILTPLALHQLKIHHVPATFFLVGKLFAEPAFVDIAQQEAAQGMAFGDHTWDHIQMTGRSAHVYDAEIGRTRRTVEHITGQPVDLFRPPYGAHDPSLDAYVERQGMLEILWTIDSEDSQGATTDQVYRNVARSLSPGDIVLLHDNRGTTEAALPRILALVERRGLTPVTVPELLTEDPPTDRQVRQHTCG